MFGTQDTILKLVDGPQERWEQECENARLWREYVDGERESK